ncbi:hypothetical protein GC194_02545 [bacterium]|nr:hypothetical protein [bacterium]
MNRQISRLIENYKFIYALNATTEQAQKMVEIRTLELEITTLEYWMPQTQRVKCKPISETKFIDDYDVNERNQLKAMIQDEDPVQITKIFKVQDFIGLSIICLNHFTVELTKHFPDTTILKHYYDNYKSTLDLLKAKLEEETYDFIKTYLGFIIDKLLQDETIIISGNTLGNILSHREMNLLKS